MILTRCCVFIFLTKSLHSITIKNKTNKEQQKSMFKTFSAATMKPTEESSRKRIATMVAEFNRTATNETKNEFIEMVSNQLRFNPLNQSCRRRVTRTHSNVIPETVHIQAPSQAPPTTIENTETSQLHKMTLEFILNPPK